MHWLVTQPVIQPSDDGLPRGPHERAVAQGWDGAVPDGHTGDHSPTFVSNAANRGWSTGANGLVTVTPLHVKPSLRSSDRSSRHSASADAASTTESQIV